MARSKKRRQVNFINAAPKLKNGSVPVLGADRLQEFRLPLTTITSSSFLMGMLLTLCFYLSSFDRCTAIN